MDTDRKEYPLNRDMNLIRDLMIATRKGNLSFQSFMHEKGKEMPDGRDIVQYHAWLLINAGLAEGTILPKAGKSIARGERPPGAHLSALTFAGHDFLELAENDSLWNKALEKAKSLPGGMTFDVLKNILTALAVEMAKNALGMHGN
jgi:hypothetical protein